MWQTVCYAEGGGSFYAEKRLGNDLLSVIRNSGVSVPEGLRMYGFLGENSWDTKICPLYRGVRYTGVFVS